MLSAARWLGLYCFYLWRRRYRDAHHLARIAGSEYFDSTWYLQRNRDVARSGHDPVMHYFDFGAREKRNPSELFDTSYYVANNAGALADGVNPLLHFIRHERRIARRAWQRPKLLPPSSVDAKIKPRARPVSRYESDSHGRNHARRYVVYTAVIGGYDDLKPPAYLPPNCDFVVFCDHPLQVAGWKVLPLNYLNRDPTRAARFLKLHPHLYFSEYDYSIWMDANIGVRGDIGAFFDSLGNDAAVGAFVHPLRDCVYEEGAECISRRKDDVNVISRHLQSYREKGIPDKIGLWETNFLVRRHNDPACIQLMRRWWQEIQSGSRRDQLSLPVVQRELAATIAPLDTPGVCARRHPLLTFGSHRRKRAISDLTAAWPKPVPNKGASQSTLTIGICVHNGLGAVRNCLASVARAQHGNETILIVDDASDLATAAFLDQFVASNHKVKLLRNTANLGYTKSANRLLKAATTDWVILLNSDTVVPPRAFRKLVEAGEQFTRLAVVGPVSNAAGWQTVPRMTGEDGTFLVNRLRPGMTTEVMDELCEEIVPASPAFVPLVNGFCFALRRRVLDEIGYFDEQRFPLGYGEEDDLCLRVAEAGYVCGLATNTYVFHSKSASFTSERRQLLSAAGQAALTAKYGAERLTALTEYMRHHPGLRALRISLRSRERSMSRLLAGARPQREPVGPLARARNRSKEYLPGAVIARTGPQDGPMV